MKEQVFIGRKQGLERLSALHAKETPNLVVIKGRRRVGKSRLVNFFASKHTETRLWDFAGLAPQGGAWMIQDNNDNTSEERPKLDLIMIQLEKKASKFCKNLSPSSLCTIAICCVLIVCTTVTVHAINKQTHLIDMMSTYQTDYSEVLSQIDTDVNTTDRDINSLSTTVDEIQEGQN
jgi:hypothetical protein